GADELGRLAGSGRRAGRHCGRLGPLRDGRLPERHVGHLPAVRRAAADGHRRLLPPPAGDGEGPMNSRPPPALLTLLLATPHTLRLAVRVAAAAPEVALTGAVGRPPAGLTGPAGNAVRMLVEEVETRAMVRW